MLERPRILHYYANSENVISADNQQERLEIKIISRILRDYTSELQAIEVR